MVKFHKKIAKRQYIPILEIQGLSKERNNLNRNEKELKAIM